MFPVDVDTYTRSTKMMISFDKNPVLMCKPYPGVAFYLLGSLFIQKTDL
jgi:hypothetical protein